MTSGATSGVDIHDAAQRGDIAAITTYIRAGGNLYAQDTRGNPPLHVASCHGSEASVAAFLGAGVDPTALNNVGQTPLYYARKNGHEGCAALLRGEPLPTLGSRSSSPREQSQQQKMGDSDQDRNHDGGQKREKKDKDRDKGKSKDKVKGNEADDVGKGRDRKNPPSFSGLGRGPSVKAPETTLPPSPPPTAPSAAPQNIGGTYSNPQQCRGGGFQDGGNADIHWHLCYDEGGNAYYFNETTGESVWAEGDEAATAASVAVQDATKPQQPNIREAPRGWAFHRDPSTGHYYYLHEVTHESLWAGDDGSFPYPEVENAAAGGLEPLQVREGDGGGGDSCEDWENGIFFTAGERPLPTAPPQFSPTMKPTEASAVGGGTDQSEEDTSMLLCTQRVMATNKFFAERQQDTMPSSSGGSPVTCAPPPAESGGRRSSCSPPPTPGTAPSAVERSRYVPTHDASPSSPSPPTTGPPAVRVEVWDTAQSTVPSLSHSSPKNIGQSLESNDGYETGNSMSTAAQARNGPKLPTGERVSTRTDRQHAWSDATQSSGGEAEPTTNHEDLAEVFEAPFPASGSAGAAYSWAETSTTAPAAAPGASAAFGLYPKVVDRNGNSGEVLSGSSGGTATATVLAGATEVEGLLTTAFERDVSVGEGPNAKYDER